jgi:translocation protein SEC63
VEEPTGDEDGSDDDISEPDEDSLAGQMAMMRGGKVKASGVHGADGDDDEDEEGSDEYESSSDEEGPKKKRAINEDSDTDSD